MTRLVVQRVEELATKQGYKSLKFLNRKKEPMLLDSIDKFVGIDGRSSEIDGIIENMDEDYGPGADDDKAVDEPLVVDSSIDPKEVADLLNDYFRPFSSNCCPRPFCCCKPGLGINSIFFCLVFLTKKRLICLEGKSMTPCMGAYCSLLVLPATPKSLSWVLEGLIDLLRTAPFKGNQP